MAQHKLHLHSMMVHSIAALALLAAVTFIFLKLEIGFFSFGQATWHFLTIFSLIAIFLILFPSILSGIFERGHVYAKWHTTHKIKLILSLILLIFLVIQLVLLTQDGMKGALFSALGVLIIFGNNIISFLLCGYGLKITLGRQSLSKTSYIPDLFKKEPVDILVSAGKHRKEEAKYLDLLTER